MTRNKVNLRIVATNTSVKKLSLPWFLQSFLLLFLVGKLVVQWSCSWMNRINVQYCSAVNVITTFFLGFFLAFLSLFSCKFHPFVKPPERKFSVDCSFENPFSSFASLDFFELLLFPLAVYIYTHWRRGKVGSGSVLQKCLYKKSGRKKVSNEAN